MSEISEKEVRSAAGVLLSRVNAPEQEIYSAARAALEAAALARAEANAGEPCSVCGSTDGDCAEDIPLRHCPNAHPAPQPGGPVEALAAQIDALLAMNKTGQLSHRIPGLAVELLERSREAISALTAGKPEQAVPSEAELFDRADWYWRTMDPDDSGDSPEEAINRLGNFVVCEIASSFTGPTRYGFTAPVLDPDSDDTEFLHFPTQEEAIEAAKQRAAMLSASPAAPTAGGGDA